MNKSKTHRKAKRPSEYATVKIESIAAGGQGFCKHNGMSVFVDKAVPGDLAEIEIYDIRKDFAHAKIANLIEPSSMRATPPCKLFSICGGCQWQHISYNSQLELKTDIVKQVMKHIGHLQPDIVKPAIASPQDLNYRNKVQFPVASPQRSSRILAGYYKEGSHELINIKHCPVQPEALDEIIEAAKEAAENAHFMAYEEASHGGLLRHIIARYSFSHHQVLLTVVLNARPEEFGALRSQLRRFAGEIMEEHSKVVGVCANFNFSRGNRIMGNETILVAGQDHIIEKLCSSREHAPDALKEGVSFQLSPASFFQVNSEQTVQLLDLVLDAVLEFKHAREVDRIPIILDAYAGVASIALWVAPLAERVLAIEEVPDAIKNAEEIIKLNNINNVEPVCGTVEEVFPRLVAEDLKPQIVILDPPRKGVDRDALDHVIKLSPQRIIYVSCNPATLARDLKILCEAGYNTQSIQPLDLFPQTFHVECIAVLDLK